MALRESRDARDVSMSDTTGDQPSLGDSDLCAVWIADTTTCAPASTGTLGYNGRGKSYRRQVWESLIVTVILLAIWLMLGKLLMKF